MRNSIFLVMLLAALVLFAALKPADAQVQRIDTLSSSKTAVTYKLDSKYETATLTVTRLDTNAFLPDSLFVYTMSGRGDTAVTNVKCEVNQQDSAFIKVVWDATKDRGKDRRFTIHNPVAKYVHVRFENADCTTRRVYITLQVK